MPRSSTTETSVMSGRCVPPVYGSLMTHTSPRHGPTRQHGRDRVGHRSQMDGKVLGLGDHPPAGIEDGGRAVAPLLDVGGVRGANERRAHLLGDAAKRSREHLEAGRVDHRAILHEPSGRRRAVHPSPTHIVAPSSGDRRRAAHRRRPRARGAARAPGPAVTARHAHAHDLDLAVGLVEPEPLAVAGVEALGEARARRDRHGQLMGLAAVAKLAVGLAADPPRPPVAERLHHALDASVRRSPTAIPSAESTPPGRGDDDPRASPAGRRRRRRAAARRHRTRRARARAGRAPARRSRP